MKLTFRLLVVDDDPRPGQAEAALEDYLRGEGFELEAIRPPDLSEGSLRRFAEREGRQFDLVMVDYRLEEAHSGTQVLRWFRRQMRYTEMVFYTGHSTRTLYEEMAREWIDGVFVADRMNLDEVLRGVAGIVIGKAVDLNHMRGIVMAEVAEIETRMSAAIGSALARESSRAIVARVAAKRVAGHRKTSGEVEQKLQNDRVEEIVGDPHFFTAHWKWRAVNALAKPAGATPAEVETVARYDREILGKRNRLAHVREEIGEDGRLRLRSAAGGSDEEIAEDWMKDLRRRLARHRQAIHSVCGRIESEFATRGKGREAEEPAS